MNLRMQAMKTFLDEEAGYDLVEFAMAGALAASVAAVAFKGRWGEILPALTTFFHNL